MHNESNANSIGAICPWTTYEAEKGRTNGSVHGPSREYRTPESESSGRMFVRLDAEGEFVEIKTTQPANAIVVRYCIPNSPDGGGINATLSLYVNGTFERKLGLTSHYSWVYGDFPWSDNPKDGKPHHFYDESHAMIRQVSPGDTLRLQKDSSDSAAYYLIDLIELEQIEPPLPQPPESLSITDFGAKPNTGIDASKALENCIVAAKSQSKIVWIPEGVFTLDKSLRIGGVTIRGAGIWHSKLTGLSPQISGTGEKLLISDLAMFGAITRRIDSRPDNAFNGNFGKGSEFTRLWIEHFKCGVWTTHGTENLRVFGCRIRNTMADGVNFCDGTSHSVVQQCHLRNTGDDALATWSPTGDWSSKQPCVGNSFVNNTIQLPWLANGIGLYGGTDHVVAGNLISDTVYSGGGILISSGHGALPFTGKIRVTQNTLERTGGECYIGDTVGSLWFHAKDSDIDADILVEDLTVREPANSAVTVHGPRALNNATFRRISVDGGGRHVIHIKPDAKGSLSISGTEMTVPLKTPFRNDSPDKFTLHE